VPETRGWGSVKEAGGKVALLFPYLLQKEERGESTLSLAEGPGKTKATVQKKKGLSPGISVSS